MSAASVDDAGETPPYAGFSPTTHATFIRNLKDLAFHQPKWLYVSGSDQFGDVAPWQGDVILRADLIGFDADMQTIVREQVPAILISGGCHLEEGRRRLYGMVAPVIPVSRLLQDRNLSATARDELVALMRSNQAAEWFYLPACEGLVESVADFSLCCSLPIPTIQQFFQANEIPRERLRLTKQGWWLFVAKLTYFFGRDEDPQDYPRALSPTIAPRRA